MSTALTVTIYEAKARLKFSRVLTLGSEYDVSWDGEGDASPSLIITNPQTDEVLAQTDESGELAMNTLELRNLFTDINRRPKSLYAYAYADDVVMGYGNVIVQYSPLDFTDGDSPELATALADAISNHIADTDNPHNVTLAQVGAAAASHTHDADEIIYNFGDSQYVQKLKWKDGVVTNYFEEYTG